MRLVTTSLLSSLGFLLLTTPFCQAQTASDGKIHANDRIIFIGDSITGQGGNLAGGYPKLIDEAFKATHPNESFTYTVLGGSGQTVGGWGGVEKRSREQATTLDVKGVDVKATLDAGADVVVIMLGMNDVLSPSMNGKPDAPDKWKAQYAQLIAALKERTKPRMFALATIPPFTEDPNAPKNKMQDAMAVRIAELAKENGAVVLPVHDSLFKALAKGREYGPNYHLSGDYVHPGGHGHNAIATAMLRGFGEEPAAKYLEDKYETPLLGRISGKFPSLSYVLDNKAASLTSDNADFRLRYWWKNDLAGTAGPAPKVTLTLPTGWKAASTTASGPTGSFDITGPVDRLTSTLKLQAVAGDVTKEAEIPISSGWLIGTGNAGGAGWINGNSTFDPEKGKREIDLPLAKGEGFGKPTDLAPNAPLTWQRYQPSIDYLGGNTPGNIDFTAVNFYGVFEVGYGARWIQAPQETKVQFKIGTKTFSGNDYLSLYVNGEKVFDGHTRTGKDQMFAATLKPGWNVVTFKSNHVQWQWQYTVDMYPVDGADLTTLKVSTVPKS